MNSASALRVGKPSATPACSTRGPPRTPTRSWPMPTLLPTRSPRRVGSVGQCTGRKGVAQGAMALLDAAAYKEATRQQWQNAAEAWYRWGPVLRAWLGPATEVMLDLAHIGAGSQ